MRESRAGVSGESAIGNGHVIVILSEANADSVMTTICWDVDTQVDFMMATGKLSVGGAEALIPNLEAITDWAHHTGVRIVATADDHDIGHTEITDNPDWKDTFPPHCMRGTPGQQKLAVTALHNPLLVQPVPLDPLLVAASVRAHRGDILLNKPGTDVFRWNPNASTVLAALAPDRIIVYGVATDVCTRAAVDGLARLRPTAKLVIVTDAIRGINDDISRTLVNAWRAAGHTLIRTAELIA